MGNSAMGSGMGGWMVVGMISWLLLVVGVVLLAVWAVQRFVKGGSGKVGGSGLDILKKRYARGEVFREEYEERKRGIS
jgi:putative membrane protein